MSTGLILTAIGAIGGFLLLYQAGRAVLDTARRQLAARGRHNHTHRYAVAEVGCRWLDLGRHYVGIRRLRVVSESNPLPPFRIGFGPASKATWQIRRVEGPVTLRSVAPDPPGDDWLDFMVDFASPVARGMVTDILIEYEAEALPGQSLPEFWYFVTESRTDELSLRVVFDKHPPGKPRFRILDQAGSQIFEESLPMEPLALECKKHLFYIRPGLRYIIDWPHS